MSLTTIPEVLITVFTHLRDIWPAPDMDIYGHAHQPLPPGHDSLRDGRPVLGWVNVTFTCQQWRRVAIDYPNLWTDINEGLGARWIDLFVQRSQDTLVMLGNRDRTYPEPIHYESSPIAEPREVLRVLPALWHRVRYLHLSYCDEELPDAVHDCLAQPNSVLERCELLGNNDTTNANPAQGLFSTQAPHLQHFACNLRAVGIRWDAEYITRLRTLVICCRNGLPTLPELLDKGLRRLHLVEWLDLSYLVCSDDNSLTQSLPPVRMPHLDKIGLEGDAASLSFIFRHLRITEGASVELRCEGRATQHISEIFPIINEQYSSWLRSIPITCHINFYGGPSHHLDPRVHVSVWPTPAITSSRVVTPDPYDSYATRPSSILLIIRGMNGRALVQELLRDVMPFCRATRLHAISNRHIAPAHLHIFPYMPQVESLYISRWESDTFDDPHESHMKLRIILGILLHSTRAVLEGRRPRDSLLLPKLQSLDIALEDAGIWHRRDNDSSVDEPLTDKLRQLLVARAALGVPLRSISMVEGSLQAAKYTPRWKGDEPCRIPPVTIPVEVRELLEDWN